MICLQCKSYLSITARPELWCQANVHTHIPSSMVMGAQPVLSWAAWAWTVVGFPQLGPSWELLEVGLIQLGPTWVK